ncbi:MAG: hypothetical protein ACLFV4_04360 [Candidatus Hydrogenedentota bacterium]
MVVPDNHRPAHLTVIPAHLTVIPAHLTVIPAKAGIQIPRAARALWIPAFAGMTRGGRDYPQF